MRSRNRNFAARRPDSIEHLESRQFLASQTPFPATTPSVPAHTILFANFDNGGEGVAYHDADRKNLGGDYRRGDSRVDIERTKDAAPSNLGNAPGVGRTVSFTEVGEYLEYTVNVASAGVHTLTLRYASRNGGNVRLEVDGSGVGGSIALSNTGSWNKYTSLTRTGVELSAGTHTLKFVIDSSANSGPVANLHWFSFTRTGNLQGDTPAATVPWPKGWTRVEDAPFARYESTIHVLSGKAYFFGGYKDSKFRVSREYSVFNPTSNTWKVLGTLPSGMAETHIASADDGKYIYLVGGFAGDLKQTNRPPQQGSKRVFRYEPGTNKWAEIKTLPQVQGAGGAAVVGRKLHFFGGNTADRVTNTGAHYVLDLDHQDRGWTTAAALPDKKDHFSTVVIDNKIYAVGGEYGHDDAFATQKSVHVYDPASDKWKRLADLPLANSHAEGSTFAYKGQIIFAGGQTLDKQQSTDRVLAYDPAKNQWRDLYHLPYPLQGALVMVVGSKVYVTQGARFTEQALPWTFVGNL